EAVVVFSSGSRHTSFSRDWSSDVCSSDLAPRPRDLFVGVDDPALRVEVATLPRESLARGLLLSAEVPVELGALMRHAPAGIEIRSEERRVGKGVRAGRPAEQAQVTGGRGY